MKLYEIWRRRFLSPHTGRGLVRIFGFLPPVFVNALRHLFSEWEYLPQGWQAGSARGQGWSEAGIAIAQERHWPVLFRNLEGPGPLGVSHFLRSDTREDRADHNAMMAWGYGLARAARKKDHISVLDWGGSLGHYYLYSRALLPEVEVSYHCYDVPGFVTAGQRLVPQGRFCDDPKDVFSRQYDLVVSSSSLHYFEDWCGVARQLAAAAGGYLRRAVAHACKQVPFYQRFWREAGLDPLQVRSLEDLQTLPVVTSETVRAAVESGELLAQSCGRDPGRSFYTGGSSGRPLQVTRGIVESRLWRTGGLRMQLAHGFRWRDTTVQFDAAPGPPHPLQKLGVAPTVWISNDQTLDERTELLKSTDARVFIGHTTILRRIARAGRWHG